MVELQFQITVLNGNVNIFAGSICPGDTVIFTNRMKLDLTIRFPKVSPFAEDEFVVGRLPVQQKVLDRAFGDFSFTAKDKLGNPLSPGLIAVGQCISQDLRPTRITYNPDGTLAVGLSIQPGEPLLFLSNPVGDFVITFSGGSKTAPLTDKEGNRLSNPFVVKGSKETIAAEEAAKHFSFSAELLNSTVNRGRQTGGAEQGDLIFIPN